MFNNTKVDYSNIDISNIQEFTENSLVYIINVFLNIFYIFKLW